MSVWLRCSERAPDEGFGIEIPFECGDCRLVAVKGDPDLAREAAVLIEEAIAARERRKAVLGDGVGYFLLLFSPAFGFRNMHLHTQHPISDFKRIEAIQQHLTEKFGAPVFVTDWRELELGSQIVTNPGSVPTPANLVS